MNHVPVMAGEVMDLIGAAPGASLLDLTVGAGGHASAFLAATAPTGMVVAADRDPSALALAAESLAEYGSRVQFLAGDSVSCLARLAAEAQRFDAVLMDLGVSSMQLDEGQRGFSLRVDAPLDMRMGPDEGPTAADLLNTAPIEVLSSAITDLGGEPRGDRIAEAIVERRRQRPFRTTGDLRTLVESVLGRRGGRIHPSTRTFQGLRMLVNRELELLAAALPASLTVLRPGGVLAVIAFHSGEDRVVKSFMRERGQLAGFELLTKRAVKPGRDEQIANRRSRSARLRALKATDRPA